MRRKIVVSFFKHSRTRTVAEYYACGTVAPVYNTAHSLRTDNKSFLYCSASEITCRRFKEEQECRASCADVISKTMYAECLLNETGNCRTNVVATDCGNEDEVKLFRFNSAVFKRSLSSLNCHIRGGFIYGNVPSFNTDSRPNPFVVSLNQLREIVVCYNVFRNVHTCSGYTKAHWNTP